MRTLLCPTLSLTWRTLSLTLVAAALLLTSASIAAAQTYNNPYYTNQTYSYGLYLPQVPQPTGQDEIHAADGTSCRSNAASNDAYLDVGGIGGQSTDGAFTSGTVYGRIIVPLGTVPKRLDCTQLYNLEIERLKHELQMVKSGLGYGGFSPSSNAGWDKTGWSDGNSAKANGGSAGKDKAASGIVNLPGENKTAIVMPPQGHVMPAADGANTLTTASLQQRRVPETGVEILPWSNLPAEPARLLTAMPSRRTSNRSASTNDDALQMIWLTE